MQYSVVNYKMILDEGFRIDPDYFMPIFLSNETTINATKWKYLNDISKKITDFGAYSQNNIVEYIENGEYFFIRNQDVKDFFLEDKKIFIDKSVYDQLSLHLEEKDILVQRVGTLGKAGIVLAKDLLSTANQNLAQIKPDQSLINPFYLITFLNSKFGELYFERLKTGNVQPWLNLQQIKGLKIPVFSTIFQKIIEDVVNKAYSTRFNSKSLYSQSEQLLLSELGLVGWKQKHELSFVKNFSDTKYSNRFDAEYFQPKYEEIIDAVKRYKGGFEELENLVKIKDKNLTPKDTEQYKYIELANISSNGEINGYTENFGSELPSRARRKVQKGDLVVSSIEGSLESIALITEGWKNALCSTGFFAIHSDKINPETLLVLLKTKIGQLQLKKGCKGTILTAIGKGELSKIVLPKIETETQKQIKEKIAEMYETKKLSRSLLEIAKHGVEMAIEKDEEEARKWIDIELANL